MDMLQCIDSQKQGGGLISLEQQKGRGFISHALL